MLPEHLSETLRHDPESPAALQQRLAACERILALIQQRLQAQPHDKHQLFLLELHQQRHARLRALWQDQRLKGQNHLQQLDSVVNEYLERWTPEVLSDSAAAEENPEAAAAARHLDHERQTWEAMVSRVRERLVKKPGDPMLMRLLGEHQARLLSVQEQLRQLSGEPAEVPTVFEAYAARTAEAPERPVSPEVEALERELGLLEALAAKTRQRLEAKPELKQLQGLIAQHEARMAEIQMALARLRH